MDLSEADAKAFWPIYDAYQKDLQQINERLAKLIAVYAEAYNQGKGSIPDATAKTLLEGALAIEEAEVALKRSHIPELNVALPAAKVVRYIQMETKIRSLVRFDLATHVPLVQ
jgi:mevalonate kinase